MKPESILQSDILDILFDGRNKDYGAYELRKNYAKHLTYSITAMTLAVAGMVLMSFIFKEPQKPQQQANTFYIVDSIELIHLPPVEKPKALTVPSPKPTTEFVTPVITKNELADSIPEAETLLSDDVQIGLKTILNEGSQIGIEGPVAPPAIELAPVVEEVKALKIFESVEQMPEFPGGTAALYRFLSRNLRAPDGELEAGDKVRIVVKFVVGAEGEITGIRFAETAESTFRREILRVMNKMPKWKPGLQNGRKVAVYYNIPVIFEAPEE